MTTTQGIVDGSIYSEMMVDNKDVEILKANFIKIRKQLIIHKILESNGFFKGFCGMNKVQEQINRVIKEDATEHIDQTLGVSKGFYGCPF